MAENKQNNKKEVKDNGSYKQLDYGLLTAQERIEYLNNMLYTKEGYLIEFYEDLFDQDARIASAKKKPDVIKDKDGNIIEIKQDKNKYVNLFPTSTQPLSEDIYECQYLEKLASYILEAHDQPRMDKQQEYNFYDKKEFEELIRVEEDELRRRAKIKTIRERYSKGSIKKLTYIDKDGKMAYLKRMKENSKCDKKQKVYKRDYKDKDIKEYIVPLEKQRQKLIGVIKSLDRSKGSYELRKFYRYMITNLKQHQEDYKTCKKGTIYFKRLLPESRKIDYDEFYFDDIEQILSLLLLGKRPVMDSDLGCLTLDFANIVKLIKHDKRYPKLSAKEDFVLTYIMADQNITQEEMAVFVSEKFQESCSQQEISRVYEQVAKKIIEGYWKQLKDFLVPFRKDGVKKCSRCNEWKLVEDFSYDVTNERYKSQCKQCVLKK